MHRKITAKITKNSETTTIIRQKNNTPAISITSGVLLTFISMLFK